MTGKIEEPICFYNSGLLKPEALRPERIEQVFSTKTTQKPVSCEPKEPLNFTAVTGDVGKIPLPRKSALTMSRLRSRTTSSSFDGEMQLGCMQAGDGETLPSGKKKPSLRSSGTCRLSASLQRKDHMAIELKLSDTEDEVPEETVIERVMMCPATTEFRDQQRVKVQEKGTTNYLLAKIIDVHPNNLYDIVYDADFVEERDVHSDRIRLRDEDALVPKMDVDGERLIWLADSEGYVYCVDIIDTVAAADAAAEAARPPSSELEVRHRRNSSRASIGMNSTKGSGYGDLSAAMPSPQPDALRVVTSWQAHDASIVSLTSACESPALVTLQVNNTTRVWSTAGELWGQFSVVTKEQVQQGTPPASLRWPPPHILASQLYMMGVSKSLCRRLGIRDRTKKKTKQVIVPVAKKQGNRFRKPPVETSPRLVETSPRQGAEAKSSWMGSEAADARQQANSQRSAKLDEHPSNSVEIAAIEVPAQVDNVPESPSRMASLVTDTTTLDDEQEEHEEEEGDMDKGEEKEADGNAEENDVQAQNLDGVQSVNSPVDAEWESPSKASFAEAEEDDAEGAAVLESKEAKGRLNSTQMKQMIKHHGFSQGLSLRRVASFTDKRDPNATVIEKSRRGFLNHRASSFGVELTGENDRRNWHQGAPMSSTTGRLGERSRSESSLLQFVRSAVDDSTDHIQRSLNIDVRTTPLREIRRVSFVARLDTGSYGLGAVSSDPTDKKSATAQAASLVCQGQRRRRRKKAVVM